MREQVERLTHEAQLYYVPVLLGTARKEAQGVLRVLPQIIPEEVALRTRRSVQFPHYFVPFVVAVDIHDQSDSHLRRAVLKYTVARRWPRVDIAIASVRLRERKESAWPLRSALTQREARQEGNSVAFPNLRWF
jgi:hypothetical protein